MHQLKENLSEGVGSLFFHVLKSLVVLFINWIILNKLNSNDYVVWSITSSILMIATASDLGIGQHTVTLLIHSQSDSRKTILINACISIIPLFFLSFLFVFFSISGDNYYVFIMALFVSFRLFSIPFGALLNATNNFKKRKVIEFITYLIGAIAITFIVYFRKDVNLSLLALNTSFIIGSIITFFAALKYIPTSNFEINGSILESIKKVLFGSMPYLVNNLTSLLTYGGFIWISSFILPNNLIAKLSVLHSFLFMTLFQVYDVFLRSQQADLIISNKIKFFLKLNQFFCLGTFLFIGIAGNYFLGLIAPTLNFTIYELVCFTLFMIVEFSYLIIQSIVQVDLNYSKTLFLYSIIRLSAFFAAYILYFIFSNENNLALFLLILSLFSFFGLLISNFYFNTRTKFSLWS